MSVKGKAVSGRISQQTYTQMPVYSRHRSADVLFQRSLPSRSSHSCESRLQGMLTPRCFNHTLPAYNAKSQVYPVQGMTLRPRPPFHEMKKQRNKDFQMSLPQPRPVKRGSEPIRANVIKELEKSPDEVNWILVLAYFKSAIPSQDEAELRESAISKFRLVLQTIRGDIDKAERLYQSLKMLYGRSVKTARAQTVLNPLYRYISKLKKEKINELKQQELDRQQLGQYYERKKLSKTQYEQSIKSDMETSGEFRDLRRKIDAFKFTSENTSDTIVALASYVPTSEAPSVRQAYANILLALAGKLGNNLKSKGVTPQAAADMCEVTQNYTASSKGLRELHVQLEDIRSDIELEDIDSLTGFDTYSRQVSSECGEGDNGIEFIAPASSVASNGSQNS